MLGVGEDGRRYARARLAGLSPEAVAADQRHRLLACLPVAFAEHGYHGPAVEEMVRRSHVSRRTFYQLFSSKDYALQVGHGEALAAFLGLVRSACVGAWPDRMRCALATSLDFAAEDPARAQLLLGEPFVCGPHSSAFRDELARRLAPRLRRGRRHADRVLFPALEQALIGGVSNVLLDRLRSDRIGDLNGLAPHFTEFLLAPYLGSEQAHRIAAAMR